VGEIVKKGEGRREKRRETGEEKGDGRREGRREKRRETGEEKGDGRREGRKEGQVQASR